MKNRPYTDYPYLSIPDIEESEIEYDGQREDNKKINPAGHCSD